MTVPLDAQVTDVLARTRVAELATTTRRGGLNTRPLTATWLDGQIVLTTPVAYPQKADNIRRDPRVAILYSDPTGSGLADPPSVLVQGTATVPDAVAAPQDLADYWRSLIDRNPGIAEQARDPEHRRVMDWYYWRLPIRVRPDAVHVLAGVEAGGAADPDPSADPPMDTRISDAVRRYPTAVLATHAADGRPWLARVRAARTGTDGTLALHPVQSQRGVAGGANLLWHKFGASGMADLLVHGTARPEPDGWSFVPTRTAPTLDAMTPEQWAADGRARSLRYLEERGHPVPVVDWDVLGA